MGKRNSKGGSKKDKSKKHRVKSNEPKPSEQQEKSAEEYFSENILENNIEQNENIDANKAENTSENNNENATENTTETNSNNTNGTNECYEEIKAKQQEFLNELKNISDAIGDMTLIRDDIDSLRIEQLSFIYFTRQMRPLIDAVNLISFASSNISNVANNININSFGDSKEIKNAFKLCYKMNDEIEDVLDALSRRIKFYISQLNNMDRNCPPFDFK